MDSGEFPIGRVGFPSRGSIPDIIVDFLGSLVPGIAFVVAAGLGFVLPVASLSYTPRLSRLECLV